jgi:hypothetical protein
MGKIPDKNNLKYVKEIDMGTVSKIKLTIIPQWYPALTNPPTIDML